MKYYAALVLSFIPFIIAHLFKNTSLNHCRSRSLYFIIIRSMRTVLFLLSCEVSLKIKIYIVEKTLHLWGNFSFHVKMNF